MKYFLAIISRCCPSSKPQHLGASLGILCAQKAPVGAQSHPELALSQPLGLCVCHEDTGHVTRVLKLSGSPVQIPSLQNTLHDLICKQSAWEISLLKEASRKGEKSLEHLGAYMILTTLLNPSCSSPHWGHTTKKPFLLHNSRQDSLPTPNCNILFALSTAWKHSHFQAKRIASRHWKSARTNSELQAEQHPEKQFIKHATVIISMCKPEYPLNFWMCISAFPHSSHRDPRHAPEDRNNQYSVSSAEE